MTGDTQCHDSEHAETLEMEYLHCDSTVCCNHYVVLVLWLQNTAYITVKSKSYTVNLVFQVKPSSSGKKTWRETIGLWQEDIKLTSLQDIVSFPQLGMNLDSIRMPSISLRQRQPFLFWFEDVMNFCCSITLNFVHLRI